MSVVSLLHLKMVCLGILGSTLDPSLHHFKFSTTVILQFHFFNFPKLQGVGVCVWGGGGEGGLNPLDPALDLPWNV